MRSAFSVAAAFALCAYPALAGDVQVEILEPSDVASQWTNNRIEGADAPFSTPDAERSFVGVLEAPPPGGQQYCFDSNYAITTSTTNDNVIVVIPRGLSSGGDCGIHQKVRVAQSKGAKGVIIYDSEGKSLLQLQQETVSESPDSADAPITIPAILITGEDGTKLNTAIGSKGAGKISAEFLWSYEKRDIPRVMYWSSAGDDESDAFLKGFAELALDLKHDLDFRGNYHTYQLGAGLTDTTNACVTKGSESYCAVHPSSYTSTGALAVSENMRRACLADVSSKTSDDPKKAIFSEPWWKYVSMFVEKCKDKVGDEASMKACSLNLVEESGAKKAEVEECLAERETKFLETSVSLPGWGVRSLTLNDDRYVSFHTAQDFAWKLCNAYPEMPDKCVDFLRKHGFPVGGGGGWPWWAWLLLAIGIVALLVGCYFLYRLVIVKHLRKEMRYEVMSEVQQQQAAAAAAAANAEDGAGGSAAAGGALGPPVKGAAGDDDFKKGGDAGKGGKEDNPFTIQRADTSTSLKMDAEEAAGDEGPGPSVDV